MRKIVVSGKTNPYEVSLLSYDAPFAIDEYLQICDPVNSDPICRVITSEVVQEEKTKYIAMAKIESAVRYPIASGASVIMPTFESIRNFVMNTEPSDGFVLGEVFGTGLQDIPMAYKGLVAMYRDGHIEEQDSIPFVFNHKALFESPHIGLFGGSGSGKTVAMKVIIEELMKRDIPGLILDPHLEMNFASCKTEIPQKYRHDFSSKYETFCIGKNQFGINFSELTTDELILIMSFSGELSGPMDALLRTLHRKNMTLLELRSLIDSLVDLINKMESGIDMDANDVRFQKMYLSKIPSFNTLIALSWRLNSLEASGIFDGDETALVRAIENRKICVLRGSMEQIHIVASHIIEKLYMLRRKFIDSRESGIDASPFPPFFIGMDEAHIFCPHSTNFSLTRKIMKTIAQEGRKYGVFELLATQRPSLLDETIVAQIANKFIFRLSIKEDLDSIGKETDLTAAEIKKLPYLHSGECYVSSSVIGRTMFVKIRYGITTSKNAINPFDELGTVKALTDIESAIVAALPFNDMTKMEVVKKISSATGKTISISQLNALCDDLASVGIMSIEKSYMGKMYTKCTQ